MNKNVKRMFFVLTLITLLATVSAVCAADDANRTAAVDSSNIGTTDTSSNLVAAEPETTTNNDNKVDTKTIEKEEKNIKTSTKTVEVNNYAELTSTINNAVKDAENDEYIINLNPGTYQITANVLLKAGTYTPSITINVNNQTLSSDLISRYTRFNNRCNITINDAIITHRIQNYANNITISNSNITNTVTNRPDMNLSLINSYTNGSISNSGNTILENSTINSTITNNGNLTITDDVIFTDTASINGNGNIIVNNSNIIYPCLNTFNGEHKFTNITLNKVITNNGQLTLNNVTLNNTINNNGVLIISDDSIITDNFVINGEGEVIINDIVRLNDYYGNFTLSNQTLFTNKRNYGNLTINNCTIQSMTNYGELTLYGCTITGNIINEGILIIDDDTIFDSNATITGNGEIIVNDLDKIISNIPILNGTYNISDATINNDHIFIGNISFNNCNFTSENNSNIGYLYLNNCTATNNNWLNNYFIVITDEESNIDETINNQGRIYKGTLPDENYYPTNYVINNMTAEVFFENNTLKDFIGSGSTLDFQGTISGIPGLTSIIIDRPVNIITSTNDGRIENFGNITYNNGASGSNITGLYTYNTQFYVRNAHNMVFDNISNVVVSKAIGWGVGQTSIGHNSTNITVKNSYFYTKDNGGSSTLVFAWADNSVIENCTVVGEGNVGNLIYLTTYNVNLPDGITTVNNYNKIINNTVIGPSQAAGICFGICISGMSNIVDNNIINYSGYGIIGQWGSGITNVGVDDNETSLVGIYNNTISNNKLYGGCPIAAGDNIYNNYVESSFIIISDGVLSNNTAINMTINGTNTIINNNNAITMTITGTNTTVENNNITNLTVSGVNASLNNNIITDTATFTKTINVTNNTFYNIITSGSNSNFQHNNITNILNIKNNANIMNNTINNITITDYGQNSHIAFNNITGTITSDVDNITIENNMINTTNNHTIIITGENNIIRNNTLYSFFNIGDNTISATTTTTIENNHPESKKFTITENNYSEYFDNNGILTNPDVIDYSWIILKDSFHDKNFIIENLTLNIKGVNVTINNGYFETRKNTSLLIENISFNNTDKTKYSIIINSDGNIIKDSNFYHISSESTIIDTDINGNYNILSNNTFISDGSDITSIKIKGSNNQIIGNEINITTKNKSCGILLYGDNTDNSINNNISFNNIFINNNNNSQDNLQSAIKLVNTSQTLLDNNIINSINQANIILHNTNESTITQTTSEQLTLNSTNTNIYLYNSDNNNITNLTIFTKSNITISLLNSSYNTIIGNDLNANYINGGNNAVNIDETSLNNIIHSNIPESIEILTEETYNTLFSEGIYIGNATILSLASNLYNKELTFNNITKPILFINTANYTIYNSTLTVSGSTDNNLTASKINFNNTNEDQTIINAQTNFLLLNSTIYQKGDNKNTIKISTNMTQIKYNTIITEGNNITTLTIENATKSTWEEEGNYLTFNNISSNGNNNILIKIQNASISQSIDFAYNNLKMEGSNITAINYKTAPVEELWPGYVIQSYFPIADNNITLTSDTPTTAIYGEDSALTICENIIIVNATNNQTPIINLINSAASMVYENYLQAKDISGNDAIKTDTGITFLDYNTPTTDGYKSIIENISMTNIIRVNYKNILTVNITDIFGDEITGIISLTDGVVQSTSDNNTLTYTPTSPGEKTLIITYNDPSGKYETTNTTINVIVESPIITIDPITATVGETINITARITAGDETLTDINKGKVTFKVNGKTLKDANGKVIYAKVINGVATIENYVVPDDWSKNGTTIQAVYSGSADCDKITSEKTNITITKAVPTLTTEDITAKAGDKITLKATITDNDKIINTGKIVFKINGKTMKDENGKVIYAKVVNNQVVLEYTLPESYKTGMYNITATFISPDYDRLTDSKTLIVTN